jgi:hypothetical protein
MFHTREYAEVTATGSSPRTRNFHRPGGRRRVSPAEALRAGAAIARRGELRPFPGLSEFGRNHSGCGPFPFPREVTLRGTADGLPGIPPALSSFAPDDRLACSASAFTCLGRYGGDSPTPSRPPEFTFRAKGPARSPGGAGRTGARAGGGGRKPLSAGVRAVPGRRSGASAVRSRRGGTAGRRSVSSRPRRASEALSHPVSGRSPGVSAPSCRTSLRPRAAGRPAVARTPFTRRSRGAGEVQRWNRPFRTDGSGPVDVAAVPDIREVSTRERLSPKFAFDLAPLTGSGLYLSASGRQVADAARTRGNGGRPTGVP